MEIVYRYFCPESTSRTGQKQLSHSHSVASWSLLASKQTMIISIFCVRAVFRWVLEDPWILFLTWRQHKRIHGSSDPSKFTYYFSYLSFLCSWKIHGSFLWLLYHKKGSMDLPVLPNVQVFYCILFFGGRGRSMDPFSYNYVTYKDPWIFHYLQNFSRCRICTHISTSHYEEDEKIVNLWVSRESYQKKLVSLDTVGAGLSGPGAPEKWALDGLQ